RPQPRHSIRNQPRPSNAIVELPSQQEELYPAGYTSRRRQSRRTKLWIDAEQPRQYQREKISEERGKNDSNHCVAERRAGIAHRVKRRRVQAAHCRCEEPHRRSDQDLPDPDGVPALKPPALEQQVHDQIAERKQRHYTWHYEVGDAIESVAQTYSEIGSDLRGCPGRTRHRRQLRRRDRHPEQAYRENVDRLRVSE